MFVKHQRLRIRYQSTTHQLHIYRPFTGTFTGTFLIVFWSHFAVVGWVLNLRLHFQLDGICRCDFPLCSSRLHPRLWLLRATSRRRSQHLCARRHSVADAPPPAGAGTVGCVLSGAVLLSPGGEESSPAPSEQNAKHEHK